MWGSRWFCLLCASINVLMVSASETLRVLCVGVNDALVQLVVDEVDQTMVQMLQTFLHREGYVAQKQTPPIHITVVHICLLSVNFMVCRQMTYTFDLAM
eukprot:m.80255 g.80255  ORF g.80255 m.80255 type:complete len:99 (-) comp12596_c0_seq1:5707-6003(-)